jgi:MFS transporter, DHA2 family, multidrug resistance protein
MLRTIAIYLILLVHLLDTAVANLALVAITRDLQIESLQGQWVVSAFAIGVGVAIMMASQVAHWAGERVALTYALLGSVLFSLASGVVTRFEAMVAVRVCHGLAAGVVLSVGQKLLVDAVGSGRRAFGLSLWSSAVSIAPVVGPLVGALFVETLTWRWIFWANGLAILAATLAIYSDLQWNLDRRGAAPDLLAPVLLGAALLSLQVLIDEAFSLSPPGSAQVAVTTACLLLSIGALVGYCRVRRRTLFSWQLLGNRPFLAFTAIAVAVNGLLLTTSVFFPIWLQVDFGLPLRSVAVVMASGGVLAGLVSPVVGRLVPRRYFASMVTLSLWAFGLSFWQMGNLELASTPEQVAVPRLWAGVGLTLFSPAAYLAFERLPPESFMAGNALSMFVRSALATVLLGASTGALRTLNATYAEEVVAHGFASTNPTGVPFSVLQMVENVRLTAETRSMQAASMTAALVCLASSLAVMAVSFRSRPRSAPATPALVPVES